MLNFETDSQVEADLRSAIFEVKSVLLHYTRARGTYQNDPGVKELSHISKVEMASHFWPAGLPLAQFSSRVNYIETGQIPSKHPRRRVK